jgi:hypothetical protein
MLRKLWNGFWDTRARIHRALDQVSETVALFIILGLIVACWVYR